MDLSIFFSVCMLLCAAKKQRKCDAALPSLSAVIFPYLLTLTTLLSELAHLIGSSSALIGEISACRRAFLPGSKEISLLSKRMFSIGLREKKLTS